MIKRKGKREKILMFLLFMMVCVTSCNRIEEKNDISQGVTEEDYTKVSTMGIQIKDEGIYFIDLERSCMMFYDYNLQDAIPICMKSNCNHDTTDCSAYKKNGYASSFGCYREYLYYIDVNDPEYSIIKSEKDGSQPVVFSKLNEGQEYADCNTSASMVFADDKLYLSCTYSSFEKDKENYGMEKEVISVVLVTVNLKDGSLDKKVLFKECENINVADLEEYGGGILYLQYEQRLYQYDLKIGELKEIYNGTEEKIRYMDLNVKEKKLYYTTWDDSYDYAMERNLSNDKDQELFRLERGNDIYLGIRYWKDKIYYIQFSESTETGIYGKYDLREKNFEDATEEEYTYLPEDYSEHWTYVFMGDTYAIFKIENYEKKAWDKFLEYPLIAITSNK